MIDIVLHNKTEEKKYDEAFFQRIGEAVEPFLGAPEAYTIEIGISLIDPEEMRALNQQHRQQDKSTDVLSFPLPTQPIPGYTSLSLGDLFISPVDVAAKALQHGREVDAQMAWTVVHGLLHLAGHDHEKSPADAEKMFALEEKILNTL